MNKDLLYQLALLQVPKIGHVHAKMLAQHFGSAEAIFKASISELEKMEGIGTARARSLKYFRQFSAAEKEMKFIEQHQLRALFITDSAYPQKLLHCYDPPTLLFYKGTADLNGRMVAIIGTRSLTAYGKQETEKLVKDLAAQQVTIVSGLAMGIDAVAHRAALLQQLPTIGVLAHGLRTIYPAAHRTLAREMISSGGGLLTEFTSQVTPEKHYFPVRNRIVAGMCDAVIVMETGIKGGSMITAELANGYHKDVFALPGRTTDLQSAGCNFLIQSNKAMLLTDAQQVSLMMGWQVAAPPPVNPQINLFTELNADEMVLVRLLQEKTTVHIDEFNTRSGLNSSTMAAALLNLEMLHKVRSLPGRRYQLV